MSKIWRHSRLDAVLLALSIGHFTASLLLASYWEQATIPAALAGFALLVCMMVYNIVVISHLFTHTPWFQSSLLNGLVSLLNSINIGQSVQAYRLSHVRNHHRYNNDQPGPNGLTRDCSSTFRGGKGGEHLSPFRYAFLGALSTFLKSGRDLLSLWRWETPGKGEEELLTCLSRSPGKRAKELREVRLDHTARLFGLCLFLAISWQWTFFCYLPAFYLALTLVNLQNYYEHYGALPGSSYANSVSCYGRIYNLLTFNDGYHQEHHLRPQSHWTSMPVVRRAHERELADVERIVSPVPAIVGFLHRNRKLLHRTATMPLESIRRDPVGVDAQTPKS
jgi:fatty acid desaturase